MNRYIVSIPAHASVTVHVDALHESDAIEAAGEIVGRVSICGQCSGWNEPYDLEMPDDLDWDGAHVVAESDV